MTLMTVTRDDIVAWLDEPNPRTGERICNRTRALYITRLDVLFRWMIEEEIRATSPSARIPKPKPPRSVPRPISPSGLQTALDAAAPRTALMLCLAAYAGLRRSEIANLTRAHILDERSLLLIQGKGRVERLVPIGPVLTQAFVRYGLPSAGPVFPGRYGGCISPQSVGLIVSEHLRSCGVDATTHQGRHAFASNLYAVCGDLLIVKNMLGHASVATTQIYAQWSPDKAAEAIAQLPTRPQPNEAA